MDEKKRSELKERRGRDSNTRERKESLARFEPFTAKLDSISASYEVIWEGSEDEEWLRRNVPLQPQTTYVSVAVEKMLDGRKATFQNRVEMIGLFKAVVAEKSLSEDAVVTLLLDRPCFRLRLGDLLRAIHEYDDCHPGEGIVAVCRRENWCLAANRTDGLFFGRVRK